MIAEAENFLNERYIQACAALGDQSIAALKINPSIENEEAIYLIQGFSSGLFSIDDEGYIQSNLLPPPSGKNNKQKMLQLFWRNADGRILFREGVCQLATVSSLVFKYGWNPNQIVMEPGINEFGNLAYGVDILIRDQDRNLTICGEVKKDHFEFKKLIEGFKQCCERGPHSKEACAFKKNHPKYEFCSAIQPSYFFATAPGLKTCFKLSYKEAPLIEKEGADLIYAS